MEEYSAQEQKVIEQLKNLKQIEADSVFLKSLKAKLLVQLENSGQPQGLLVWSLSKVLVSLTAFLLLLGGTGYGISKASQISDPSNPLYRVRITSERIQLSFAGDKSTLHARFAKNRLEDLQKLEASQQLADANLQSVLNLYLENLAALQEENEQLSADNPEFAAIALKLEGQLKELETTISQLSAQLQTDSLTQQALTSIQEAEALSLWNRQLISLKILAFQKDNNVLLGTASADQLERIAILLEKVSNRFAILDARWQDVFSQKTLSLNQDNSLAPEKQAAFQLTNEEQAILNEVGQVKTGLNETQSLLSQKSQELVNETILLVINKLFEIDNNLAKIEVLLGE